MGEKKAENGESLSLLLLFSDYETMDGIVRDEFNKRVQKTDDHWLWTGAKTNRGYGKMRIGGEEIYARRISYALENKKSLDEIAHLRIIGLCLENSCVRPDHLFAKPTKKT